MAPQGDIPIAAYVLGTIGTVLWCVQLIPQIYTNWRTKKTDGLPASMMFLWAICGVPFGTYDVVQNFNLPLQIQPQIFMVLCLVSWAQILVYSHKWAAWKSALLGAATAAVFGGVETALILTLRPLYDKGVEQPILAVGIVASILLAVGLLPPYGEAWKRRGRIIGINWVFLSMDSLGAFFSLMSLAAQNSFDILGGVMYIICMLLEAGIFSSHLIWRFRTRKIRKEASCHGKTFDDIASEHREAGIPFKFAERERTRNIRRWRKEQKRTDVEAGRKEGSVPQTPRETTLANEEGVRDSKDHQEVRGDGGNGNHHGNETQGSPEVRRLSR